MDGETYNIKTNVFEGPFGLLLNLIEKRKLFINDLSLAQVTEDYLKYINELGSMNPAEISSFVYVASTLILIKSKSLLPNLNMTLEEEGDIHSLEERLRLYEIFSKLSVNVKDNFGKKIIFPAMERKQKILVFLPDREITKDNMMTFARHVLGSMPKKTFMPEVEVKKVISIEEMIDKLTERVKTAMSTSFKQMHGGKAVTREERVVVIVGFLAMLELVRQGIIDALQENGADDIIMNKREEEVVLENQDNNIN